MSLHIVQRIRAVHFVEFVVRAEEFNVLQRQPHFLKMFLLLLECCPGLLVMQKML